VHAERASLEATRKGLENDLQYIINNIPHSNQAGYRKFTETRTQVEGRGRRGPGSGVSGRQGEKRWMRVEKRWARSHVQG